jgi:hypothetical protein
MVLRTPRDSPSSQTTAVPYRRFCVYLPWSSHLIRLYLTTPVDTKQSHLYRPYYLSLHIHVFKTFPTVSEHEISSSSGRPTVYCILKHSNAVYILTVSPSSVLILSFAPCVYIQSEVLRPNLIRTVFPSPECRGLSYAIIGTRLSEI